MDKSVGEKLRLEMEKRGLSPYRLAVLIQEKSTANDSSVSLVLQIELILLGYLPIDRAMAFHLEATLNIPYSYWINTKAAHRDGSEVIDPAKDSEY